MSYSSRMARILAAFDITPTQHLPINGALRADGSDRVEFVDGVEYWIGPKGMRRKSHRVMARCPSCGDVVTAGKLPQHERSGRCVRLRLARLSGR